MTDEEKGFIIKDRRIFADEGQAQEEEQRKEDGPAGEPERKAADDAAQKSPDEEYTQLPEINFATFVFSLNSSALVHLGMIEDPATGQKQKNLPIAKQTIDILGMLDEKTKGNLTQNEENLLKNILHDLRLMYVKEKS